MNHHRGFSWAARLTALVIFPLVFVGAGVTSKDAGMAYPDGFTANGHFWTNPAGWWAGEHTRWEHGHRQLGRLVGILAIITAAMAWPRAGAARILGVLTLVAIILQGLMGAFRVNAVSTGLAMVHGIWGQLCFCLACATALVASRVWETDRARFTVPAAETLRRACLATCCAIVLQLILGAALRHFGSNAALIAHALWAMMVSMLVGWVCLWVIGQHSLRHPIGAFACLMGGLTCAQLVLGGVSWIVTIPGAAVPRLVVWLIPTLHTACGALILVCSVMLTLCVYRMLRSKMGEALMYASPSSAVAILE